MNRPDITKKFPNIPSSFLSIVDDVDWSAITGEPSSPFWLCVSEETEKFGPFGIPKNGVWKNSPQAQPVTSLKTPEFKEYVRFLCALSNDERVQDPSGYSEVPIGECGFVIRAFPFALPIRNKAQESWSRDPAVRDLNGKWRSMAEWTTIGAYRDCLDWIAQHRHEQGQFADFRRKRHPFLAYCAGKQDAVRFHAMWTDEEDGSSSGLLRQFVVHVPHTVRPTYLAYRWLNNGEDTNMTLLVLGPSLVGQAQTLNNEYRWKYVALELRHIVGEQYPEVVN